MLPESELKTWHREVAGVKYICSTDPKHVQLDALNAAFRSDMLWWAHPLPEAVLKKLVEHSMCFGLYVESSEPATGDSRGMSLGENHIFGVDIGLLIDVAQHPSSTWSDSLEL